MPRYEVGWWAGTFEGCKFNYSSRGFQFAPTPVPLPPWGGKEILALLDVDDG